MPFASDNILSVPGVEAGTARSQIKDVDQEDLLVVALEKGTKVVGVFTQNHFRAAPVEIAERHLHLDKGIRALIINSGNANAATGEDGELDALKLCNSLSEQLEIELGQVLPFSTGVIGERLPVDKMLLGIEEAVLNIRPENWEAAASAILTTDTVPKICSQIAKVDDTEIHITGIAKGSGMIKPNMATMLAFIFCDVKIDSQLLKGLIKDVVEESFNRITVDGDTSTNDAFLICATGAANNKIIADVESGNYLELREGISNVAQELSKMIVKDGEGASRFVKISVHGGLSSSECLSVAYSVAESPLVKTAMFAGDPNWGRFCMAIGNANVPELDTNKISLYLDEVCVARKGQKLDSYKETEGSKIMRKKEYEILIELGRGRFQESVYSTDLSHGYITINSEYRS
ncbi:MAG: bifunctional ornithine acetyltransferase/N-acetylglutamate synthase [Gammaproteobacteria bacterium]|nr:bifunctional ornithine acetyltransferase/N-acetylglutamate synthase [Gammaproteobacteria bacterium]